MDWVVDGARHAVRLTNGVLIHQVIDDEGSGVAAGPANATLTSTKAVFLEFLADPGRFGDLLASGDLTVDGDSQVWPTLLGLLDSPDPDFEIVLP